jgi:predicted GIY-YIG superfamily endonuclease
MEQHTTVYLIHFERAFWHAQHYIGLTVNLEQRLEQHRKGNGAKLLRAINARGIPWQVVRTWPGGYTLERALKNRKKSRDMCPVCLQQRLVERCGRAGCRAMRQYINGAWSEPHITHMKPASPLGQQSSLWA